MKVFCARIEGIGKTGRVSRYFQDRQDAIRHCRDRFDLLTESWDGRRTAVSTSDHTDHGIVYAQVKPVIVH